MVSKKTIMTAVDLLNMDQCEMASRITILENRVASLERTSTPKETPPKVLKTAKKGKAEKKPTKKVVKKNKVGRPRKTK